MTEYKVKFEVFEGPLDLLLYLIKKEEVDIYEVNLTQLATQFIEYIDVMRLLDLEIAGEFLVMASTLMYIKSRELLPVDQQVTAEGEEEGDDPRWELIRQLVEYKKFKDAAAQLQTLEVRQEQVYPRLPVKPEFGREEPAEAGDLRRPQVGLDPEVAQHERPIGRDRHQDAPRRMERHASERRRHRWIRLSLNVRRIRKNPALRRPLSWRLGAVPVIAMKPASTNCCASSCTVSESPIRRIWAALSEFKTPPCPSFLSYGNRDHSISGSTVLAHSQIMSTRN